MLGHGFGFNIFAAIFGGLVGLAVVALIVLLIIVAVRSLRRSGPMGMGCIDYLVHGPRKPKRLVVTDIDKARLDRAASLMTMDDARKNGVELSYVNTMSLGDPVAHLRGLTEGKGYNDVFVFAPVAPVVEQADAILGRHGRPSAASRPGRRAARGRCQRAPLRGPVLVAVQFDRDSFPRTISRTS